MSISVHKNMYEHISDENMGEYNSSWNYIWELAGVPGVARVNKVIISQKTL